jgi:hypothetical protein
MDCDGRGKWTEKRSPAARLRLYMYSTKETAGGYRRDRSGPREPIHIAPRANFVISRSPNAIIELFTAKFNNNLSRNADNARN